MAKKPCKHGRRREGKCPRKKAKAKATKRVSQVGWRRRAQARSYVRARRRRLRGFWARLFNWR